jgi:putative sterol carrier protein
VEYLEKLAETGVDTVRILPQWNHTIRIVQIYRDVLEHRMHCADAAKELKAISTGGVCNGWFLGKAGWVYESPNKLSTSTDFHSQHVICSEKQPYEQSTSPGNDDTIVISRQDFAVTWSNDEIARELDELTETMNHDKQFMEQMATFKATTIVISATDTKREFIILLDKQGVQARPYAGESFDVMFKAAEQILWEVLSGRMDADAAFFAGKVNVCGSAVKAFRVKNRFLSILQKHVAHKLEVEDKLTVNP